MLTFSRAHTKARFSGLLLPAAPPHGEPLPSPASAGDPPPLAFGLVQSPAGSLPLAPRSWGTQCSVCPFKRGLSAFPRPVEVLQSKPSGLQRQTHWGYVVSPFAGSPDWEAWRGKPQNLHNHRRTSLDIIFLLLVGCPPRNYGILFYCDCAPSCLLVAVSPLSLDRWCLFLCVCAFKNPPIFSCPTTSCKFRDLADVYTCF